jgi:AraC-like DNA-binding protein
MASAGSQSHQIARAIEWLKRHYTLPRRIDDLAAHVHMSPSTFYQHFRVLTAMSPLQYQKWLRLNEARRLMLTERLDAATAAFQVGYESPSHFSREYRRVFGAPPLRDITSLRHMAVVAFFLGQMSDPGDLIGLMHKDEATGRSVFLPPYWWLVDGKPIVLFLDELNRARPEILQSVHELALNKTLAGKRLPDGSIVVSAVNAGDEYQLTDLGPALVSRFNLYEFAPTVEDWLLWATAHDVDPRVTAFIQQNTQYLDGDETAADEDVLTAHAGLVKTPTAGPGSGSRTL